MKRNMSTFGCNQKFLLNNLLILVLPYTNTSTVGPLLSAELDYPRFLRPKFGTRNLCEKQ